MKISGCGGESFKRSLFLRPQLLGIPQLEVFAHTDQRHVFLQGTESTQLSRNQKSAGGIHVEVNGSCDRALRRSNHTGRGYKSTQPSG